MGHYLGISGLAGTNPNPAKHIRWYAEQHPRLGIRVGEFGHDATAALVEDGRVVFAVEEERLNRSKHFMGVPVLAAEACCRAAGVERSGIPASYYIHPSDEHLQHRVRSFQPIIGEVAADVERDFAYLRGEVARQYEGWPNLRQVDHHHAHAASAFYCSGFERALVAVVDGQAESAATTLMLGDAQGLHPVATTSVTGSLGMLYAEITAYLGFEVIEDEYKIMGLAAYGKGDEFRAFFDDVLRIDESGTTVSPSLLQVPDIARLRAWSRKLGPHRRPDQPIEDRHIEIASSLQRAVERAMLRVLEVHEQKLRTRHLCLAGGVALNCSMNGVIDRTGMFDRIFVQPAAGDSGAALGAALVSCHAANPEMPRPRMVSTYLGPSFTDEQVRRALDAFADRIRWTRPDDYVGEVARLLADGRVLGWFQGRMEFGPRALGNRSILADPRRADMKDRVNQAVKKREEFRPFAPSVTSEGADAFFELRARDQYEFMTVAVRARPERSKEIPSVVHVNGTARVHVVRKEVNPRYWELLSRFGQLTGVPVVLNTSFNVRGEPIVCTPEDAVRCFLGTGIDHLAIEGYLVSKVGDPVAPSAPPSPR